MATPRPALDLTTDAKRPFIHINDVPYELRTERDLTLDQYRALERLMPRAGALLMANPLSAKEGRELHGLLDQICRIVLEAPEAVQRTLSDVQRAQISDVFTTRLLAAGLLQTSATPAASRSGGRTPSRGSSGSTAGAPRRGSRTRRSA